MHHVAIMNKKWNLIDKILSGRKKIESRWYKSRISPWNKICKGDVIYFKNAGENIVAKANVSEVRQFENLTEKKINNLIDFYGGEGKICFFDKNIAKSWALDKNYCILIFLTDAKTIPQFSINKKGFGNACAWITIDSIHRLAIK